MYKNIKQEIVNKVENAILQWDQTRAGNGDFGARTFLFQNDEFGHMHADGTLDIVFGPQITMELLRTNLVKKHLYVPDVAISFKCSDADKIPFAISLLRLSYLLSTQAKNVISSRDFETELTKLPESLSSIDLR